MTDKSNLKRNLTIVLMVVLVVFFFSIENIVRGCSMPRKVSLPQFKSEEIAPFKTYFRNYYQKPEDYILEQLTEKGRDILFIGDTYSFRQNINLIKELIPALYAQGISCLGVDYVLYADQAQIDTLLTAGEYDEQAVYRLLFNRFVLWGYQEYAEVFRAAWQFNQNLKPGARPFRVLGVNMKENWQYIQQEKDQEDPEIIKQVYADGLPDDYIYNVIQEEVLSKNQKAVIYCNLQHALLHYINQQFEKGYGELGFDYKGSAARQLYEQIGERCGSVFFHGPWPSRRNPGQPAHPAEGYISFLITELPPEQQVAGFDVEGSPFGEIQIKGSFFAEGKDKVYLKDLCSGYIINGPINRYEPATAVPGFINQENYEEARRNFPGPKDESLTIERLNTEIENNSRKLSELLQLFEQEPRR